jgi:hypothetical protein
MSRDRFTYKKEDKKGIYFFSKKKVEKLKK